MDAQVVRQDKQIAELADKFILLRITYMRDTDIALFGYDYDQTWMTFFLDGEGRVYSRFGSRDASSAESYNSVEGLAWTMKEVLKVHKADKLPLAVGEDDPSKTRVAYKRPPTKKPGDIPALHDLGLSRTCVRCHMIHEAMLAQRRKDDGPQKGEFWMFPPPENVGLKLDRVEGNLVSELIAGSAADKAGLKAGDRLKSANGVKVFTRADFEAVLNALPATAKLTVVASRGDAEVEAALDLPDGWRRCDPTWRKSVRQTARRWLGDVSPLSVLSADEKKPLQIGADDLALAVKEAGDGPGAAKLPAVYRLAGLKDGDVIVAFDGKRKQAYRVPAYYPMIEHVKGEKMEITFLRDGKEQTVTVEVP